MVWPGKMCLQSGIFDSVKTFDTRKYYSIKLNVLFFRPLGNSYNSMFKKSWPILYCNLPSKMSKEFLDILCDQEVVTHFIYTVVI